jgi:preprotein translocase subunit YajC
MNLVLAFLQDGPSLAGQPAATTAVSAAPGAPGAAPASPMDGGLFWILIPVLLMMMLFSTFAGRKQKKQRAQMLADLRKNDRVVTAGGIIGSVVEVKPDRIVLRVDEGRDTKLTFTRDAITSVLQKETAESGEASAVASK